MFTNKVAEAYQRRSSWQRETGKQFVETVVKPCLGDAILDLGCGTGELSAYLSEQVGPKGNVLGVDPDVGRLKLAQESHKEIENLSFAEGSTSNFPGMGCETYNIIFSNLVLHWIPDVEIKKQAFKNMFGSLKPGGKIAMRYGDRLPTFFDRVYRDLNPENLDSLLDLNHFEARPAIEQMCVAAGFNILNSYDEKFEDREFENGDSLCSFFWATTRGVFNPQLVTKERLAKFCARHSSGEAGKIKVRSEENDFCSVLIAVNPKKETLQTSVQFNNNKQLYLHEHE